MALNAKLPGGQAYWESSLQFGAAVAEQVQGFKVGKPKLKKLLAVVYAGGPEDPGRLGGQLPTAAVSTLGRAGGGPSNDKLAPAARAAGLEKVREAQEARKRLSKGQPVDVHSRYGKWRCPPQVTR